jgi:hypothetical protein
MATWKQLEDAAARDRLKLFRTPNCGVTLYTTDSFPQPLMTITAGDLTDDDADAVLRKTTETALRALMELPR